MPAVYVVTHRATGRHYVGKANRPRQRWARHVHDAPSGDSHFARAIALYGKDAFSWVVVEDHDSEADAFDAEAWWVEFLRAHIEGFNLRGGGEGGYSASPALRAKLRAAYDDARRARASESTKRRHAERGHPMLGTKMSAEARANMRGPRGKRGPLPEDQRAKIAAAQRGHKHTEAQAEAVKRLAAERRGTRLPEEQKRKASESLRAKWQDPEYRARMAARPRRAMSEETKQKIREANTGKPLSEERKAKISAAKRKPKPP